MLDPLTLASHGPVIPVIVLQRLEHAVPLAEALLAGGVKVLEVTLRTPVALRCIEAIAKAVPQALVGAGTIRSAADARAARDAGSVFGVSPGYTTAVGAACRDAGLSLLPGVATASEVMAAMADGLSLLKFFPASAAGGLPLLKALYGPFPDVRFCPTGGITPETAPSYLALANVPVCGGSWLTPNDAIEAGDWPRITRLAQAAALLRPV
jgi:2-dehydro-3-deoxyphosphogluconate aldolase/(4S)-4-hydroxy-2-oxoglutarate aldolase